MPRAVTNPKNSSKQSGRHSIIKTIKAIKANRPERIKHIILIKSILLTPIMQNSYNYYLSHLVQYLYILKLLRVQND